MDRTTGFDLRSTLIHLGLGGAATEMRDFEWSAERLSQYESDTAADGSDGRLVMLFDQHTDWPTWERHPSGAEVVVLISGRCDLIQLLDGTEHRIAMTPGTAAINPPGVWHTADVHEPGQALFITPGLGTEQRGR